MRTFSPLPPAWRVLLPTCLGTALSLSGDTTLYTVLPTHTAQAGVTFASVGLLLSLNRWVRLPLNRPAGRWIETRQRKPVFVAALLLGALSTVLYALDLGLGIFLAARALWGVAWVGIWLAGNTIVLDVSSRKNRGRFIGIYQIAFFTGAGGGAFLGGVLTDFLGYHPAMLVNAALSLFGGLAAWAFLPETLPAGSQAPESSLADPSDFSDAGAGRPIRFQKGQLTSALALLASNRLAMEGFLVATLAIYLRDQLGESIAINDAAIGTATLAGLGLGATTLVSALAAPASGTASDRAGTRWRIVAAWLLPGIAGFSLLPLGTPLAIFAGLIGISAASGSNANLATALIGDLGRRDQQGRRLGTLFTVGDLASAAGPLLAFWMLPLVGLRGVYFTAASLFALMFFVSVLWAATARNKITIPEP